jgi:hypothetical protein
MAIAWPGPADVDEQTLQVGPELGSGGQGRGTRPDTAKWTMALSDRDEIALPPVPPVRQRLALPHKPLDGDPGMPRPVIQLPSQSGTNPAPNPVRGVV